MSPDLPSTPSEDLREVPSSPLAPSPTAAPLMVQNVTECNTSPSDTPQLNTPPGPALGPPLSDRQLAAIPLILSGLSDTDIAANLGVSRVTIFRWRNQNPAFIARLNVERHLRHAATADRYDRLLNQAMDLVERFALDSRIVSDSDVRIAQSILRSAAPRLLALSAAAPTNPADILQSLLSQGLPPDTTPDTDPPTPEAAGGHRGSTRGARG